MNTVATVISVSGLAWVQNASGERYLLTPGDQIQPGESLVTTPTTRVELDFGGQQSLAFVGSELSTDAAVQSVDMPVIVLPTPSSNDSAPKGEVLSDGHGFVQLVKIAEIVEADGITPLTVAAIREVLTPLAIGWPDADPLLDEERYNSGRDYETKPADLVPPVVEVELLGAGEDGVYNANEIGPDGTVTAEVTLKPGTEVGDDLKVTDRDGNVLLERPVTEEDLEKGVLVEVPVHPDDTEVTVNVKVTDPAGNTDDDTDTKPLDGIPPSVSVELKGAGEDGVYNAEEIGPDGSVTADVTLNPGTEVGDTLKVTDKDGNVLLERPVTEEDLNNGVRVEVPVSPDDKYVTVNAKVTDPAGNTDDDTDTKPIDGNIPAVSVELEGAGDDGIYVASEIGPDNSVTAKVTLEPGTEVGDTLKVTDKDGNVLLERPVTEEDLSNGVRVEVPVSPNDEDVTVHAKVTDPAGNTDDDSDTKPIDNVPPAVSVELQGTGDDGIYNEAEIGPDGTVTAQVTLEPGTEVGDTLKVTDKDGKVLLERPVTENDLRYGVSVEVPVKPGDTDVTVNAKVTDPAGNTDDDSDTKPIDNVPPAVSVELQGAGDDGIYNADEIGPDNSVTAKVTLEPGTEVGDTLTVTDKDGEVLLERQVTEDDLTNGVLVDVPVSPGDEDVTVNAKVSDPAGNTDDDTDIKPIDMVPPAVSVELQGSGDDGIYNEAEIGPDGTVTAQVTLEPGTEVGDTLRVTDKDGEILLERQVTEDDLTNGVLVEVPVKPGDADVTVNAKVTDPAGNTDDDTDNKPIDWPVTVDVPVEQLVDQPDGNIADQVVFESGLSTGSAPNPADTQVKSDFTLTAPDGLADDGALTISYTDASGVAQTEVLSKADVEALGTVGKTIATQYGELVLNGYTLGEGGEVTIAYDYVLQQAPGIEGDATQDSFTFTATDADGDNSSADLNIKIVDDAPLAKDDANRITEDEVLVTGNVIANGSSDDVADIQGADGATVTGITSTNMAGNTANEENGNLVIKGQYGTLTIMPDGRYTYELDNANTEVNGLKDNDTLEEVFNYTLTDADNDRSTADLTITIDGNTDGAPGVDVKDHNGVDGGEHSIAENATVPVNGEFTITAPDGLKSLQLGAETLTPEQLENLASNPVTINGSEGLLTLTGYDPVTGTITYEYQQNGTSKDHTSGDNSVQDSFAITVTDKSGDFADSSLTVEITDTAPVANPDTNSLTENDASVGGNVILDAGTGQDELGADETSVTGVVAGTENGEVVGQVGSSVNGQYGSLTLNADGTYTYNLDSDNADVNALKDGQTLTDTFSYTIKDADGDWSTTTVTITVNGKTDGEPTITPDDGNGTDNPGNNTTLGQVTVYEKGLVDGDQSQINTGSIAISAEDGLASITVHGRVVSLSELQNLGSQPITIETPEGELTLTGFTPDADVGGVPTGGSLTFRYELQNVQNTPADPNDPSVGRQNSEVLELEVTDAGGETGTGQLVVNIIDDTPDITADNTQLGSVTVDETALGTEATGEFANAFKPDFGADGPAAANSVVYSLEIGTVNLTNVIDIATGKPIKLVLENGTVKGLVDNEGGADNGETVFTITVDANGKVTLTQQRPMKHSDASDPDDSFTLPSDSIKLTATVEDKDGDNASASINIGGKFEFKDDGPSVNGEPDKTTVDEKYLSTGSEAGQGSTTVTATLPVDAGEDGIGSLTFAADQTALQDALDATGNTGITISVNGHVLTATRADGQEVFTVTLDKDTGEYTFELKGALTHPSAVSGNFDLSFNYEIKDADGDTAPGKFEVNVIDDAPKSDISITTPEDTPFGPFTTSADSTKDNVSLQNADGTDAITTNTLPDGVTAIPAGTAGYNVGHGVVVVDENGKVIYHPNKDYSNDGSEDSFKVTVSNDDGTDTVTNVTVNVLPVSDAPDIPHGSNTGDVDAASVNTLEDTPVKLELKTPVITDATDQNGSAVDTGDNPERLGAITLTVQSSGTPAAVPTLSTTSDSVSYTDLIPNGSGGYTIVIVDASGAIDTSLHVSDLPSGDSTINYLTRAEYEAIQASPEADRHENFDVVVSVDSFEVDDSGVQLSGVPGANNTQTITVDVQAVTDAPEISLTEAGNTGATSIAVTEASGGNNGKITVSMEEDGTLNLQDVLGETLKDTDGSESYWYDISGLPAGTVVTINGKKYTADSEGNISMPEADYMNTNNGGNPGFSIKLPKDYSNSTADKVTITLNTQDSDNDSSGTIATESVSVDLELRVYAKPDDVKLQNPDATPEDTAVAFLDKLGLNDTDGSESITQVRITELPTEGGTWTLYDHNGAPVTVPAGGDASGGGLILTVGTGGEYTLDQIKEFTLQPPAHSSSDGTIKVYITTEEDGANTASGNPESQEWAHDLNITVTPVAEDANTDSDGSNGVDVTINPSHEYTTAGNEDEFMLLGKDAGFSLETGWSNEDGKAPNGEGTGVTGGDGSEETFALLTPYDVVGNNAQINETGNPLDGSVFRYSDGTNTFEVVFNGEPVKIPVEYLDSLEFKGPANFSGVVKIKVEAGTVDYDEDTGAATNMAVSGESWLTNVIVHPVADQVTLKVNARITTDEDVPVALNINPTSSDSDETFNVTISGIPAGATITYNGVEYSEANGNITGGSLIIEDFDASKQPTLTPPKDSNESINLKVEAVSVDTLTYIDKNGVEVHSPVDESLSQELDINITVQGVPDEPKLELVQDKVYVEQDLDDADEPNQVALSDLITSFGSGETTGDGSETVTLRLSGLPEGFNLVGAGSVLGGSGPDRVWVIDENQLGNVKITLPPNYSGSVSFTAQPVVTENDNDSETFFDPENIGFTVTPSPEADLSVSSNLTEDTIGKLDLSAVHQNGDTDEFITEAKIKAVDGFTFYSDADGTTELIPGADGYYVFSGADVNSVYVKADANFSGTQRLEVEYYKVTDPSTDGNVDEVTVQKGTATHDLIVGAVTDNIGAELNTITAVVSGEDSFNFDDTTGTATVNGTGKVTVKVDISQQADANAGNKTDTDGSEQLTHIVIDGVPQGVNVEGAVQTAPGQWLINTSDSFNADTLTKDLVFNVTGLAGTGTSAITVTGYSKDTGASSQKQAEISFNLDINQGPGPDTELPDVELSDKNTVQTEDSGFSLAEQVVGTITGGNVDSYQITVTLRTSPDDDTVFTDTSGDLLTRTEVTENGETVVLWTKSVDVASGDNADTKLAGLLDEIKVLAPEHANNNNLPGGLPLDVTVSVHADGLSKQEELKPSVSLTPATDETTVTVAAAPAGEGEDISLNISLENLPDGGFSNVEGDILYVQLGDTGLAGELLDADGNTLKPNDVTGVYEIPLEANGQPPALTFRPDSNQPHQTGSLTVNAWVNNQETGASNIIKSEGNGTLIIEKSNSGFEATITAEGDEQTQDLTTPAPIELNLAGQGLVDTDEVIDAAFINGLPPGFVVYVGADAATAGLANNAGKDANGNNIWSLPITDPSGLPGYIAVVPPKNWSGTLDGLKLTVMSGENGLAPTPTEIDFDLVVNPVADGITLNPTLSFGDAGDVIKLNLNAAMKDPVANDLGAVADAHVEQTTLQLTGLPDGEKVVFYIGDVELDAGRVTFADGAHTLTGLTQDELDNLGMLHLGTEGINDVEVTAWTQEVSAVDGTPVGDVSAETTGTIKINVSDKLPTNGDDALLWTGKAVDGREGSDTIQLRYTENLGDSDWGYLSNVEVIDLGTEGANAITSLTIEDVLSITDDNNTLRIAGDAEDSLSLLDDGSTWTEGSTANGYTTYTGTSSAGDVYLEVSSSIIIID
ncbi:DUF5801 repeats-in-toxin domain-containing protein [Marinobacterium marinum]|uniref:Uncharacterized protein n=1 Tax=Marinobacterium marinum TaxID=2756129 RepID=A0A7W1WZ27_9GAMM|nr:DUF5801 repeats-in-toxin domain-containing protein [Marinobacterium marinum]MBA4502778.1 hypothetical protein [Marinobacterium marinum]